MVPVQRGKLLAIVPREGIACIAMITTHSQFVELSLVFHPEAGIFCICFSSCPVFQSYQKLVVTLVSKPVYVLQAQPIFTINISKALLWELNQKVNSRKMHFLLLVCFCFYFSSDLVIIH